MKTILALLLPVFVLVAQKPPQAGAIFEEPAPVIDPRKIMLHNLLDAGILLLEGKAYRQFIQAFVDDEDRRKFEQAFGKKGTVDYNEWGREKGEKMLEVLKIVRDVEPVLMVNRACYVSDELPRGKFSLYFAKGGWFIENKSGCPDSAKPAQKDLAPPTEPKKP